MFSAAPAVVSVLVVTVLLEMSPVAATDAVLKLLKPGDEVITGDDLYGGTYRLFTKIYEKFGIKFHFIDLTNAENLHNYINENTRIIWAETPTNPTNPNLK